MLPRHCHYGVGVGVCQLLELVVCEFLNFRVGDDFSFLDDDEEGFVDCELLDETFGHGVDVYTPSVIKGVYWVDVGEVRCSAEQVGEIV